MSRPAARFRAHTLATNEPRGTDAPRSGTIKIVSNPETDTQFASVASWFVSKGVDTPGELERRLNERYPRARVVVGMAGGADAERWYVYREGRWVNDQRSAE